MANTTLKRAYQRLKRALDQTLVGSSTHQTLLVGPPSYVALVNNVDQDLFHTRYS